MIYLHFPKTMTLHSSLEPWRTASLKQKTCDAQIFYICVILSVCKVNFMLDKVGVAVIGVGVVGGQAHAPSFKKIEGSELVALGATTERRVKTLAERLGGEDDLDNRKH